MSGKKVRQAVILAGGQGTRLRPLTLTTPKPLIPIHGKPFAAYLLELLKKNDIEEVVFLTGYLGEQFPPTLGDGSRFGLGVTYAQTPVEDETGERLRKAKNMFDDTFLLLYGDNHWPLSLPQLLALHVQTDADMTGVVYRNQDPTKKNNILVEDSGLVGVYDKKRETSGLNGIDIGFFLTKKTVIERVPEGNVAFEPTILPQLIAKRKFAALLSDEKYVSLTSIDRLPGVEHALSSL
jgi:NDP-sugar pyrophosphorylase family protein